MIRRYIDPTGVVHTAHALDDVGARQWRITQCHNMRWSTATLREAPDDAFTTCLQCLALGRG